MATDIAIGGIGGDITDGGGAAPVVVDVFNAMWNNAQNKSTAGKENIDTAIALAGPAPQLVTPNLDTAYLPPLKPILPQDNPADGEALYNTALAQMMALTTNSFASFIDTYFPDTGWFDRALAWADRAITEGGTGIDAAVEAQLWERDRARILADSQRAEDEAQATWADRRFPLPPGALTNQVNQIRLDAGRKLAAQSRDISVKSFDTEIENVRLAVKSLLDLRIQSLNTVGDYIKTVMMGPQTAMQLATGLANIRSEAARTLVALYSAESAALEPRVRLAIADANLQMDGARENLRALSASIDAKVRAALSGAQMVGQQAAAGLNAINASASISGSDSSQV